MQEKRGDKTMKKTMRNCCDYNCPVDTTIDLIGGKYKALILWHLIDATLRFSEISRLIPSATQKMLTQQLREMERAGLIIRTIYNVVPPKVDYRLSELGASIRPILETMYDWGARYLNENGTPVNCSMQAHRSV